MNEQEREQYKAIMALKGHYSSLMQALTMAMTKTFAWRAVDEEGFAYSLKELYEFAKRYDVEHPLNDDQFFMVTREGAIGLSPGLEWLTQWMFLPMEEGQERDFVLQRMKEQVQEEHAVRDAVEQAVLSGMKAQLEEQQARQSSGYYIFDDETRPIGPYSVEELLRRGLSSSKLVKLVGSKQWVKASMVQELKEALARNNR